MNQDNKSKYQDKEEAAGALKEDAENKNAHEIPGAGKKTGSGQKRATNRSPYKRGGRRGTAHKKNEHAGSNQ
jgi:hypothetical protein